MSFDEIRYKGKPVKRDGYAANNFKAIAVAIEHNGDGSVTVCKEIADEIYTNGSVPEDIRNYFKPSDGFKFMSDSFTRAEQEMEQNSDEIMKRVLKPDKWEQ